MLTGCAAVQAGDARTRLIGMSRLDMETCAGVPAKTDTFGADEIATYTMEAKGAGLSAGLPLFGTLSLSTAGQCTAVWRLHDGRVAALHYTAADGGLEGPISPCAPLIRDCLRMRR